VNGCTTLYYPKSPPWQRWRPVDGLLALIDLARDHVFLEDHGRATGGPQGGTWLGAEAPHGFPGWRHEPGPARDRHASAADAHARLLERRHRR